MQVRPIDFALLFSKAHKNTADRLTELMEQLDADGHSEHARLVQFTRAEHLALANSFLDLWKEAQDA